MISAAVWRGRRRRTVSTAARPVPASAQPCAGITRFFRRHWQKGALGSGLILLNVLLAFPMPLFSRFAIDDVILGRDLPLLPWVLLLMVAVALCPCGASACSRTTSSSVTARSQPRHPEAGTQPLLQPPEILLRPAPDGLPDGPRQRQPRTASPGSSRKASSGSWRTVPARLLGSIVLLWRMETRRRARCGDDGLPDPWHRDWRRCGGQRAIAVGGEWHPR